eukprot:g573.t1
MVGKTAQKEKQHISFIARAIRRSRTFELQKVVRRSKQRQEALQKLDEKLKTVDENSEDSEKLKKRRPKLHRQTENAAKAVVSVKALDMHNAATLLWEPALATVIAEMEAARQSLSKKNENEKKDDDSSESSSDSSEEDEIEDVAPTKKERYINPNSKRMQKKLAAMRPGDWLCPSCNAHNFSGKIVCFRCKMKNMELIGRQDTEVHANTAKAMESLSEAQKRVLQTEEVKRAVRERISIVRRELKLKEKRGTNSSNISAYFANLAKEDDENNGRKKPIGLRSKAVEGKETREKTEQGSDVLDLETQLALGKLKGRNKKRALRSLQYRAKMEKQKRTAKHPQAPNMSDSIFMDSLNSNKSSHRDKRRKLMKKKIEEDDWTTNIESEKQQEQFAIDETSHPSWIARQKAKEAASKALTAFAGKKITFD